MIICGQKANIVSNMPKGVSRVRGRGARGGVRGRASSTPYEPSSSISFVNVSFEGGEDDRPARVCRPSQRALEALEMSPIFEPEGAERPSERPSEHPPLPELQENTQVDIEDGDYLDDAEEASDIVEASQDIAQAALALGSQESSQSSSAYHDLLSMKYTQFWRSHMDAPRRYIESASYSESRSLLRISKIEFADYISQVIAESDNRLIFKRAIWTIYHENQRKDGMLTGPIRRDQRLWNQEIIDKLKEFILGHPKKRYCVRFDVYFCPKSGALTPGAGLTSESVRRRTATQIHEEGLQGVLREEITMGHGETLLINNYWICQQSMCKNYSGVCWVDKRSPTDVDDWRYHMPLTGAILSHWNGEVIRGESTVEEPSDRIRQELRKHKADLLNKKKASKDAPGSSFTETMTQYVQVLLAERLASSSTSSTSTSPSALERQSSPPIKYSYNPEDDTRAFFSWWDDKEMGAEYPIPVRLIQEKLLDDKWRINDLRDTKTFTPALWKETYDLPMGYYGNLQRALSAWKIGYRGRLDRSIFDSSPGAEPQYMRDMRTP